MKKSNKFLLSILVAGAFVAALTSGCAADGYNGDDSGSGRIKVVTTLFPQYSFARTVGGDRVEVSLLIPPGMEPHSYEPTPKDVVTIGGSAVFIYTGSIMEPWVGRLIGSQTIDAGRALDMSANVELITGKGEHDEDGHGEGAEVDPHFWLDPSNARIMVEDIRDRLISMSPGDSDYFTANARKLIDELDGLDLKYRDLVKHSTLRTIIYGGHFTFGYFAHEYGIDYISPYSGFSPNSEPTISRIIELSKRMEELGIKYVYYEEMLDPKVARAISENTGATLLLLHGAHNVSKDELSNGVTFMDIMNGNLERLKRGLGYDE